MQEEKEDVEIIEDAFIDVTGMYYGRNGSNDYSRRGIEIDSIVYDADNRITIIWEDKWTRIASGIETGIIENVRTLRIHQTACPVRVRFRHYNEYVSYDNWEHNSSWEIFFWTRYERSENLTT